MKLSIDFNVFFAMSVSLLIAKLIGILAIPYWVVAIPVIGFLALPYLIVLSAYLVYGIVYSISMLVVGIAMGGLFIAELIMDFFYTILARVKNNRLDREARKAFKRAGLK